MEKIPLSCVGVKCMQTGCTNQAMHKVAETNIWDYDNEPIEYLMFTTTHALTTYLCDDHFNAVMKRDVHYGDISLYKSV